MEAELLRGMVSDREQRIVNIKRKTAEQKEKELRLSKELEEVSAAKMETEIQLQTTKTRLLHSRQQAFQQLEAMQRDLQQQGSSLQSYAGAVKQQQKDQSSAVGGGVDTSYVMRMQAQLCKAMHSLGIGDHQMELAKAHADALIKMQRDAVAAVREEKSQVELELMNELMKRDTEHRTLENQLKARLDEIRKDVEAVNEQLENSDSEDDDGEKDGDDEQESEEEEEDEEEKEMKEELMKLLQERKEEIQRLEKENEEQLETLQELEEQIQEIEEEEADNQLNGETQPGHDLKQMEADDATEDSKADEETGTVHEDAKDAPTPESSSNGEMEESAGALSEEQTQ